jgi:hypothetical protein
MQLPLTSRLDVEDRIDAPGWAELQEDGTLEGQIDRQILAHFFNSLLEWNNTAREPSTTSASLRWR